MLQITSHNIYKQNTVQNFTLILNPKYVIVRMDKTDEIPVCMVWIITQTCWCHYTRLGNNSLLLACTSESLSLSTNLVSFQTFSQNVFLAFSGNFRVTLTITENTTTHYKQSCPISIFKKHHCLWCYPIGQQVLVLQVFISRRKLTKYL